MTKIIGDEPCPSCRSMGRDKTGNHLMIFSNGNKYCNRCGHKEIANSDRPTYLDEPTNIKKLTIKEVLELPYMDIKSRGIKKETCEKYEVRSEIDETNGEIYAVYFPVHSLDGKIQGFKRRLMGKKKFKAVGSIGGDIKLFGQANTEASGRKLLITEGEFDCLAGYQMLKERYPDFEPSVVSIPNGSNGAKKACANNLDFILDYQEVIIAMDQDEAGDIAKADLAELIGEKAKVMRW